CSISFIVLRLIVEVNNFFERLLYLFYIVFIIISMVSFTLLKSFFKNIAAVFDDFIILSTL
ncbi:TPA: hypothetical protein ACN4SP_002419, partial [Staphylococcus aureus]